MGKKQGVNTELSTSFVTLAANIQRLSESEVLVVQGVLKGLEVEIVDTLQDNPDISAWRKARLNALLKQTRGTIQNTYKTITEQHNDFMGTVGEVAAGATNTIFDSVGIPLQSVIITPEQWKSIASNAMIVGAPSKAWWAKQSQNLQDAFMQQMRIGYASGESIDELVKRVRGTSTGRRNNYLINGKTKVFTEFKGGIMDTGTRQAEALVRTSVMKMAADAKMEMFKKNADILKGVMWQATLDLRTTKLCAAHSGKMYTLDGEPIGHNLSWMGGPGAAHWNCVPGYSKVQAIGKLEAVYRRWHEGKLVIIHTSTGTDKATTANHPILTLRGWVPANGLVVGDKIVKRGLSDSVVGPVCANDIENKITTAHELAQSSNFVANATLLKVPTTPQDFHNEGADNKITHIWANNDLCSKLVASLAEHSGENNLLSANFDISMLASGFECLPDAFNGLCTSTGSGVGLGSKLLSLVGGSDSHSGSLLFFPVSGFDSKLSEAERETICSAVKNLGYSTNANTRIEKLYSFVDVNIVSVANIAPVDPMLLQEGSQGGFADIMFFAYFADGAAVPVHFDDVVNVKHTRFSGHVYNLQCSSGAFFVDDMLTHNCRSTAVPITKSFEELGAMPGMDEAYLGSIGEGTQASMNGAVPASMTFDTWFRTLPEKDQIAYLGKKKYEIWKKAGLNFEDMIDQRGNPLTVKQLAKAYGVKIQESIESGIPNVPKEIVSAIVVEQRAQLLASKLARQQAEQAANSIRALADTGVLALVSGTSITHGLSEATLTRFDDALGKLDINAEEQWQAIEQAGDLMEQRAKELVERMNISSAYARLVIYTGILEELRKAE